MTENYIYVTYLTGEEIKWAVRQGARPCPTFSLGETWDGSEGAGQLPVRRAVYLIGNAKEVYPVKRINL